MSETTVKGDATGGLIPYKNGPALVAYYTGIASLIPVFGMLLGPTALVFGVLGLKKRKQQPEVKGAAHAWIGIVIGVLCIIVYGVGITMVAIELS